MKQAQIYSSPNKKCLALKKKRKKKFKNQIENKKIRGLINVPTF